MQMYDIFLSFTKKQNYINMNSGSGAMFTLTLAPNNKYPRGGP